MLLPQTAEYALRAAIHLAMHADRSVRVGEMAEAVGVPHNYLSKTMHQLVRAGVFRSTRGPTGGFRLAVPADELTLDRVVAPFLVGGERRCLLGKGVCGEVADCQVHERWLPVARQLDEFFTTTTVAALAAPLDPAEQHGTPSGLPISLLLPFPTERATTRQHS